MTKAENEDVEIGSLRTTGNIDVKISAGRRMASLTFDGAFLGSNVSLYPDEAELIAQALLKAVEHIKAKGN